MTHHLTALTAALLAGSLSIAAHAATADPWAGWSATMATINNIVSTGQTTSRQMPTTGTASYLGGTAGSATYNDQVGNIVGGVSMDVNFRTRQITGTLSNLRSADTNAALAGSLEPVNFGINASYLGSTISGAVSGVVVSPTTTVSTGTGVGDISLTSTTTLLNGKINGAFFGKGPKAMAGTWDASGGTLSTGGSFGAYKR